jgi:hypothetical protein
VSGLQMSDFQKQPDIHPTFPAKNPTFCPFKAIPDSVSLDAFRDLPLTIRRL